MITEQQEAAASEARGRSRQDKRVPLLVNRDDLRLIPNTPLTRKLSNYVPYEGKATDDEPTRRRYVEGRANFRPRIINSREEADTFDIGKASKDELITFAADEYGLFLDAAKSLREMRIDFAKQAAAIDAQDNTKLG